MPTPNPTVDELIAAINRSALPTVVVEGKEDVVIYRWMETVLRNFRIDFLPCHSRTTVLNLFERRGEIASVPLVFVADLDLWALTSPPLKYDGVLFTGGYSIENDVLSSRSADKLFDVSEKVAFNSMLQTIEEWFAFEASEHFASRPFFLDVPVRKIVDDKTHAICAEYIHARSFVPITGEIREQVRANPLRLIRGKTLLDAYAWILNTSNRPTRYGKLQILELCIKLPDHHPECDRLITCIRTQLGFR